MIKEHREKIDINFEGTIVDIETIGDFNKIYRYDSRQYQNIQQVILGYINKEQLQIYCATDEAGIDDLKKMTPDIIKTMARPYYAFNCSFERGVWFNHIGVEVDFDGELQGERFESKKNAVRLLKISNYDDPFYDIGLECMKAWSKGDFERAIAHNRACLLKERDILIKRGHCTADQVRCIR
jgi:hypothetical protein